MGKNTEEDLNRYPKKEETFRFLADISADVEIVNDTVDILFGLLITNLVLSTLSIFLLTVILLKK